MRSDEAHRVTAHGVTQVLEHVGEDDAVIGAEDLAILGHDLDIGLNDLVQPGPGLHSQFGVRLDARHTVHPRWPSTSPTAPTLHPTSSTSVAALGTSAVTSSRGPA